jgi:hypothetical protein
MERSQRLRVAPRCPSAYRPFVMSSNSIDSWDNPEEKIE